MQVPAISFSQSALLLQPRYGFSEQLLVFVTSQRSLSLVPQMPLSCEQSFGFCCARLGDVTPPVPFWQVCPAEHSLLSKHGCAGSLLQNPQWHQYPHVTGCSGASAQTPWPVQFPSPAQWIDESPVQRLQSALLVHTPPVGSSVHFGLVAGLRGLAANDPFPHCRPAVLVVVPVPRSPILKTRPVPAMLSAIAGAQSDDVPPKNGVTPSTVQVAPSDGPPSQVNVSPTAGLWFGGPQRGHGCAELMPRYSRVRRTADSEVSPVAVSNVPDATLS